MRQTAKTVFATFLLLVIISSISFSATVLPPASTTASEVVGLHVGDYWYDVVFTFGLYPAVFSGGQDVTFDDETGPAAGAALADVLNTAARTKVHYTNGFDAGFFQVPVYLTGTGEVYHRNYWFNQAGDKLEWEYDPVESGTENAAYLALNWAVFTESAVPLPGAVWLLGSGLIGIVGIRRKFKK